MGRATDSKEAQIQYLKNRVALLNQVAESLHEDSADEKDLENVLKMLADLKVKVERFHADWSTNK